MTMKENQNAAPFDSKNFGMETDALTFESKETYESNDSIIDASPVAFEAKNKDESLNCKVIDDFSMDGENGPIDSPRKEGQSGLLDHLRGWDKDSDSLSSDSYDIDKEPRSPDHESSATVEEFADCNDSDFRDSGSPCNAASNLFTVKNKLECEPMLEVCHKEIDCQILKDICVDEGRPEKEINVTESCKDEKPGHLFPQTPIDNDHFEATEDSPLEHANSLSASQYESKEENDGKIFVSQGRLELFTDNPSEKDKHCDPGDSIQMGEANCGATGKAETDSSEEDSLVDGKLPVEDFGERNKFLQPPDQILNGKAGSEGPAASSAEAGGTGEDVEAGSLLYNSKVESGSITFSFNSPVRVVAGNGLTEDVEDQSAESVDVHKDGNADNPSDTGEVHCASSSIENVQEQSLIIKDANLDGGSATGYIQCVRSKDSNGENAHEQSAEHKDTTNSDDFSTDGPVQFPSNKSESSANDVQAIEPTVQKHEQRNSSNVSVVSQLQHDEGETSFSAASLITYSGPMAYSGSLSHRSDGSTTSGKSFAFPVLQSEWNSSPVRMAKADRRHFRKHKGWRSGLLCCRF